MRGEKGKKKNLYQLQAGPVLHNFFLCNFTFRWLEIYQFNAMWHGQSVAMPISSRRLTESDITVTPSGTCMSWLSWWYNHAGHLVSSSTALALSEKRKSISSSAIQVKTWQKTTGIEGILDIISWLEKGEWIVDIYHNVRLAHSSIYIWFVIVVIELRKVLSV